MVGRNLRGVGRASPQESAFPWHGMRALYFIKKHTLHRFAEGHREQARRLRYGAEGRQDADDRSSCFLRLFVAINYFP